MDEKFSCLERIKKNRDFRYVFKNGRFARFKSYSCYYIKTDNSVSRIGIAIKKRLGNAVRRNYEKRIIREYFRHHKSKLKSPYDIIILIKDLSSSFREKQVDFIHMLDFIQKDDSK